MLSGSSISFLKAPRNSAPTAPSTAWWTTERVQLISVAMASAPSFTTGRGSPAPTARMQPCGGLMKAAQSLMTNMSRLENDKLEARNCSGSSLPTGARLGEREWRESGARDGEGRGGGGTEK